MKFFLLTGFLFIFGFTSLFAQTIPDKRIRWIPEKECQTLRFSDDEKKDSKIECDSFFSDNRHVKVIKYNGIKVAVVLFDDGDYFGADVFIENRTDGRVEVDREDTIMGIWKTEDRSDKLEILPLVLPEQIVSKIRKRVMWANIFGAIAASTATTTATSQTNSTGNASVFDNKGNSASGTYTGNSQTTTTTTDRKAQAEEARRMRERNAERKSVSASILEGALKNNTLFENQSTNGFLYFKRNKKAKIGVFTIGVNGVYFDYFFNNPKK